MLAMRAIDERDAVTRTIYDGDGASTRREGMGIVSPIALQVPSTTLGDLVDLGTETNGTGAMTLRLVEPYTTYGLRFAQTLPPVRREFTRQQRASPIRKRGRPRTEFSPKSVPPLVPSRLISRTRTSGFLSFFCSVHTTPRERPATRPTTHERTTYNLYAQSDMVRTIIDE
ncbi:hypothetical protein B0H12DRAFT_171194 [Mycena haematopus]|nr:hypothetical protein B0H12DRAFT_171194 [Mycena haematopus]